MLLPLDTGIVDRIVDGERMVTIHGRWEGTSDTLAELHFLAALGDAAESPLRVDLFALDIDCPIQSRTVDGTFRLADLCREGGAERLFLSGDSVVLKPSVPNPVSDLARVEFRLIEPGRTRLTVVDLRGDEVAVPVDAEMLPGRYEVRLDVSGYAPGSYILRLRTPTTRRSVLLRVVR